LTDKTEADEYAKVSTEFARAYEVLSEEINLPPSLEVFRYGIEQASKGWKRISATEYAKTLVREAAEK
jgi:hypothetical protein